MNRNPDKKIKVPESVKEQYNYSYWILKDLEDTIAFGESFILKKPNIKLILLQGKLGAGKTSLVKGIAKGLGITEPITSPTFPLVQHYSKNKQLLVHLDLYRLEDPKMANELFLQEEEELKNEKYLMVVEWPERLNLNLQEAWRAKIEHTNEDKRIIQIISPELESIKANAVS